MENSEMTEEDIKRKRSSRVRTHGLKFPWHPFQIGAWIFYLANFFSYYLFVMISFKHNTGVFVVFTIIFTVLILVVFILAIISTLIDPTDEVVKRGIKEPSPEYAFY